MHNLVIAYSHTNMSIAMKIRDSNGSTLYWICSMMVNISSPSQMWNILGLRIKTVKKKGGFSYLSSADKSLISTSPSTINSEVNRSHTVNLWSFTENQSFADWLVIFYSKKSKGSNMIELPIHRWGMEPTEQSLNPIFWLGQVSDGQITHLCRWCALF